MVTRCSGIPGFGNRYGLNVGCVDAVMNRFEIHVPEGLAFEETVLSHGWYHLAPFRWDQVRRVLNRVESLPGGETIDLAIRMLRGKLVVESDGDLASAEILLRERLNRMFQFHVDLTEFHDLCRRHPTHIEVAGRRMGRLLCGSTLFEDAVKIIATTNTTWRQTVRMIELLVANYGSPSKSGNAFPQSEQLALLPPGAIRETCRFGYRGEYVQQLARGFASGDVAQLLSAVPIEAPSGERLRLYQKLPGIGPYGAAHLLAMEGRHDFIAVDTEFRRFVREQYHGGRAVSDATMTRRYSRWGRWKYLAYWCELRTDD